MSLSLGNISFDSTDPLPLAQWWAERLGGKITAENQGWFIVVATPLGPNFTFQKVPDPTPGKNRIHLDFESTAAQNDVESFMSAGASHVANHDMGGFAWTVLGDPEGNQFCISQAHKS